MREIRTSGLMSGERKRATASWPRTAPFLDSTHRSAHMARVGNLLRSLLLAPGDAPRHGGRNHSASHRGMDGADGSELRLTWSTALCCPSAMRYTIATLSSAVPFERCFSLPEFSRFCCRLAARI